MATQKLPKVKNKIGKPTSTYAIAKFVNEYFPYKFMPKGNKARETPCAYYFFNSKEMQTENDLVPVLAWFGNDFYG